MYIRALQVLIELILIEIDTLLEVFYIYVC